MDLGTRLSGRMESAAVSTTAVCVSCDTNFVLIIFLILVMPDNYYNLWHRLGIFCLAAPREPKAL